MEEINLYRKRFIPKECILLKKDEIVYIDENIIITKWKTINPRADFNSGNSIYYIKEGFKISQMYLDKKKIYTYCDIIDFKINGNDYICEDLLVDVIIENDGFVKILDIEEIANCLEEKIITQAIVIDALSKLDRLLQKIYAGELYKLINPIDEYIN